MRLARAEHEQKRQSSLPSSTPSPCLMMFSLSSKSLSHRPQCLPTVRFARSVLQGGAPK
ncbi:hypothetical protein Fmac_013218 [Flemingia macrophylla]|uniref:Uncharacterized protein n=1 Tax=Flemingia macrophylla TaxID=520843 RepID=A0ABD1MSI6_9FABA